jgi:hypothetical protein
MRKGRTNGGKRIKRQNHDKQISLESLFIVFIRGLSYPPPRYALRT